MIFRPWQQFYCLEKTLFTYHCRNMTFHFGNKEKNLHLKRFFYSNSYYKLNPQSSIFCSHFILEFSNCKNCKLTSSSKYSFLIGQVPIDSSREHCLWKPNETRRNWTKEKMTVLIGQKSLTQKNILCIYTNSWSNRIQ
jgi:hypothetical protein